jgi:hypothetical protein
MIIKKTCDPIPFLIAWVRIRVREVPWSIIAVSIIIRIKTTIPVRSIRGFIKIL